MTQKVKEHILAVRATGGTNMFDVPVVQRIAQSLNFFELVNYLADRDNWKEYSHFIMTGEAPIEDDESEENKVIGHVALPYKDQINIPTDMNDPEAAKTAVELQFPDTFCAIAHDVIRYFDGSMFLYRYKDHYVVTDESLYLTDHGDGSREAPYGGPRWTGDDLDELESWLEGIAADYDAAGDIPGWPPA